MRGKKKALLSAFLVLILAMSMSTAVFARVTISLKKTTMATGIQQRIYTYGSKRTVNYTSMNGSVLGLRKDSSSVILVPKKAGTTNLIVRTGNVRKRFRIKVLSDKQIANRVVKRIRAKYRSAGSSEYYRRGKALYVWVYKPQGDGAPNMLVKVNLQTGRAVCGSGWSEFFSRVSKSFVVF